MPRALMTFGLAQQADRHDRHIPSQARRYAERNASGVRRRGA
jgi:hypothetical protein